MATTLPLTISAGQSMSTALEISVMVRVMRIGMPAAWDSAPLTFQVSPDGTNFQDLYHVIQSVEGGWVPYEATVLDAPANGILLLPPEAGFNVGWLKLRSGTRALPVKQSAARQFAIVVG